MEDSKTCIWNMGPECSGKVEEHLFFDNQIRVTVCERHAEDHKNVMILHANGYNVEEVLEKTEEYRKNEVAKIKAEGEINE